jgi:DNA-binding LacI/PurR family transcriptional regulator
MKVTMKDIAETCGVSKSLVSRIVNNDRSLRVPNKTRKRIVDEIERTGYVRNVNACALSYMKNATPSANRKIGYVTFTSKTTDGHPYFSHVLEGIVDALSKTNCRLALSVSINELNSQMESICEQFQGENQLDGIILLGNIEIASLHNTIKKIARYVISMDGTFDNKSDFVGVNLNESIQLAIDYVIKLGYTDVGLLCASKAHAERLQRCHFAMSQHKLAFNENWVLDGGYTYQTAYQIVKKQLESHNPPRCIVAWNDEMALGGIKALTESGYRVPEDVAMTGHDDIPIAAYADVPLTTVHLYKEELGSLAVEILLQRIENNRKFPIKVEVPSYLVKRTSCGRKSHG